jgi:dTDP-4-dehydrorhamnose 3,5-epimerase
MTPTKNKKNLSVKDFSKEIQQIIKIQDYISQPKIHGVETKDLNHFTGEDGYFAELGRLSEKNELLGFPGFKVKQISRSILESGAIKAFHLHLRQDDVWYVSPESWLLVGLVDLRKNSPTYNQVMKFSLGSTKPRLLRIPKGVAHGAANLTNRKSELIYFTNQYFTTDNTDEHRLPWDFKGKNFWEMSKG